MSAEKESTLWDHLRELRDRLVRCAIFVNVCNGQPAYSHLCGQPMNMRYNGGNNATA